jgi:hypothetical protein
VTLLICGVAPRLSIILNDRRVSQELVCLLSRLEATGASPSLPDSDDEAFRSVIKTLRHYYLTASPSWCRGCRWPPEGITHASTAHLITYTQSDNLACNLLDTPSCARPPYAYHHYQQKSSPLLPADTDEYAGDGTLWC